MWGVDRGRYPCALAEAWQGARARGAGGGVLLTEAVGGLRRRGAVLTVMWPPGYRCVDVRCDYAVGLYGGCFLVALALE
jgi:hypothetical protein